MAVKPDIIPFTDFVKSHQEEFTPFELWVVDELTEYLVNKLDLDKEYTSVIVDIDADEPVSSVEGDQVNLRFNGRFYLPKEDRNGKSLGMTAEKWAEFAKGWFDENDVAATFNTESTDLLKFTVLIAAISLPEGSSGESSPAEEPAPIDEAEAPSAGEETAEEPTEPTPAGEEPQEEEAPEGEPEETAPSEPEDSELKEFEDALGI